MRRVLPKHRGSGPDEGGAEEAARDIHGENPSEPSHHVLYKGLERTTAMPILSLSAHMQDMCSCAIEPLLPQPVCGAALTVLEEYTHFLIRMPGLCPSRTSHLLWVLLRQATCLWCPHDPTAPFPSTCSRGLQLWLFRNAREGGKGAVKRIGRHTTEMRICPRKELLSEVRVLAQAQFNVMVTSKAGLITVEWEIMEAKRVDSLLE